MRSYVERAQDFIKQVYPYIKNWNDPLDVATDMWVFNVTNKRKVRTRHGLSRIALITSDYVVKYDYGRVSGVGGCESEVRLYAEAVKDGFDYLFAQITPFKYKGRIFYIMPRINGIGRNEDDYADEFMTVEEEQWCNEHDLTDLHSYNFGFRKGKLCIVDYAYWAGR